MVAVVTVDGVAAVVGVVGVVDVVAAISLSCPIEFSLSLLPCERRYYR